MPVPTSASALFRRRRPEANGGASNGVWSPGYAITFKLSPSRYESAPSSTYRGDAAATPGTRRIAPSSEGDAFTVSW